MLFVVSSCDLKLKIDLFVGWAIELIGLVLEVIRLNSLLHKC